MTWPIAPFGKIVQNVDARRVPLKASDRSKRQGQFPYYGASGIIDSIDEFIFEGEHLLIAEDGANLLARSTPVAFRASGRFWVNNHAHVVKSNGKADLQFLEKYFTTVDLTPYVTGSAQPKLNRARLDTIPVPLPPLPEQKRIAAILDKADAIRRKRQEAIRLTQELLRSAFLEMFGDPVTNPKGWKVRKLCEVIVPAKGQVDPRTDDWLDVPHVGGDNITSYTGALHDMKTPRELQLRSGKYPFDAGWVLYSKIRPYLNKVALPNFSGLCSADIYPLRPLGDCFSREYLACLLRSDAFMDFASKHSSRTSIPKLNRPTMFSFEAPIPVRSETPVHGAFERFARVQVGALHRSLKALSTAQTLGETLTQRAFSGML